MSYHALGFLETYGYIPAIVGLDAALKAAKVTLKDIQWVGGGLVTITVEGDVAAVTASIQAAAEEAKVVGEVITQHVISRADHQLALLFKEKEEVSQKEVETLSSPTLESRPEKQEEKQEKEKSEDKLLEKEKKDFVLQYNGKETKITSKKELFRMKVVELRKIARGLEGFSMEAKKIKFANKSELVNAILTYMKMEVE